MVVQHRLGASNYASAAGLIPGWVARTRSLAEPLSPRGPQPVLRRLRGFAARLLAVPQHGPWALGVSSH